MTAEEFLKREEEIQMAHQEFPDLEIGEAYMKWKTLRGEVATMITFGSPEIEAIKTYLREGAKRPCTQKGCSGIMELESICAGCVEGRKGYKTKWTCAECLHRELSRKDYYEWLKELSGFSRP